MKSVILILFSVIFISQCSYSQDSAQPANYKRKTSFNKQEKTDYFDLNFIFGIDNNKDFMIGTGIGYRHRYKFLGFGMNLDMIIMKNFFLQDEVSELTIPHNDYRVSDFENRGSLAVDLFGSLNYGGVFLNTGMSFLMLGRNNYYISNITGLKWKGETSISPYYGFLTQVQFYIPRASRIAFTITAEARFMQNLNNFYALKIGMWY